MRPAVRSLSRSPAFTVVVILTLALGIGASTAVLSLMNALLWRPLPVEEPDRLVLVTPVDNLGRRFPLPSGIVDALREEPIFEEVCSFSTGYSSVTLNGATASRATHMMAGECFETLGIQPALGRFFSRDDGRRGSPRVAVLSHAAWVRQYGGSTNAIGQVIDIAGEAFTVIGVAGPSFRGLLLGFPPQVFLPSRSRLAPSVTPDRPTSTGDTS